MIKKKKVVETWEYILEEKDISVLKSCVDYCFHRMSEHGKYHIANASEIQRLKEELQNIIN